MSQEQHPWFPPANQTFPLAQILRSPAQLRFVDPFTSGAEYRDAAYPEIGSNDPANPAYTRRVLFRALWTSPTFNLRPELGTGAQASVSMGTALPRTGALGQGARALIRLDRKTLTTYAASYNYSAVDRVSVGNSKELFPSTASYSLTAAVQASPLLDTNGDTTLLLPFAPPGNPVQYWNVTLVVDIIADSTQAAPTPAAHTVSMWAG